MANFCEKCKSIILEINDFKCCSNKRCGMSTLKTPKVNKKGQGFMKVKKTGNLVDKETGTVFVVKGENTISRTPSQCKGCNKLKDDQCSRVGTNGTIGVCWMEPSEGEY